MSDRIKKLMSEGRSRIQNRAAVIPASPCGSVAPEKSDSRGAGFVALDVPAWKRESLKIVLGGQITPDDLEILTGLSPRQKYLFKSLKELDACDVETLSRLVKDKSALRAKLTLLSAWSNISKNGSIQKGVGKVGGFFNSILSR